MSIIGFTTQSGKEIKSSKIILTTGTFLNGLIHIGEEKVQLVDLMKNLQQV